MNDILAMRVFTTVVQTGSISAASRALNMSISAVSRYVNFLEEDMNVTLLNRTTRNQRLTEAGQFYFQHVLKVLNDLELIKRNAAAYSSSTDGLLRVQCRSSVGASVISRALPEFCARYPHLKVELILTDEKVDLVYEGIDMAVWLGHLEDSSLIAKRLAASKRYLLASPDYLARHSTPLVPDDIKSHNCLVFTGNNNRDMWSFERNHEIIDIPVAGSVRCNNSRALLNCALGGVGLVLLHSWMVKEELASGALVPILQDYSINPNSRDTALYAVYPHTKALPMKVRHFIDYLVELFARDAKRDARSETRAAGD